MKDLTDRIVVITGASKGIGRATARQFTRRGARVVCLARDRVALESVLAELNEGRERHLAVTCDIAQPDEVSRAVEDIVSACGRIDIWVNNAGIGAHRALVDTTLTDFDAIFGVNIRGVFLTFKALIPLFLRQKAIDGLRGHIINISSSVTRVGAANLSVYAASKAALNTLSESVANEVRNDGIKISVLSPASTDTDLMRNYVSPPDGKPLSPSKAGRKLTAEEVAEAVFFEASQNSNAWTSMADIRPLSVKKQI